MSRPRRLLRVAWAVASALVTAACNTQDHAQFTLHFPSVYAAVTPQEIGYYVFDANESGNDCVSLIKAYQANAKSLPSSPTYTSPLVQPCDLLKNPDILSVPLTYGNISVLAFSKRKDDASVTFLFGCATQALSSSEVSAANGSSLFDVYLSLENPDVAPPPGATTCSGLTDYCANRCSAPTP
jgi:hypothetical protein